MGNLTLKKTIIEQRVFLVENVKNFVNFIFIIIWYNIRMETFMELCR